MKCQKCADGNREKFFCTGHGDYFVAGGNATDFLSERHPDQILCFDCKNDGVQSGRFRPKPAAKSPKPAAKSPKSANAQTSRKPPAKPKPKPAKTKPSHQASGKQKQKTTTPPPTPPKRSLLGKIWDAITGR